MALTDTAVRNAKAGAAPKSVADERGLSLLVQPSGGKWWRFRYRFDGKQKMLSVGVYPDVSLKQARERRDEARRLLAEGIDPGEHRKATKTMAANRAENSFEAVAREWFAKFSPRWAESHASKVIRRFDLDVFPWIGGLPVNEISSKELLAVLRRIEERGTLETAHKARQNCGQVFRYAIATGRADNDPSVALRGALPPLAGNNYPTITDPKAIGELLRAIDGYAGSFVSRAALQLAPLVFVRPGELRQAEWSEIDLDTATWIIPGEKMKAREKHVVPLSTQSVAILRELYPLTGRGRFVFPGERSADRPLSENTVLAALRRLGYEKGMMTGHGFRAMASTLLNEQGWNRDAIERQLAHGERDAIRAAYNHAEHLPERRMMMQHWADYLDQLAGRNVVPLRAVVSQS
ncbi:MAG: integrase arm-type DNA-binding domain-containing protein [Magnetococcales bacterium]|nr:integrase arm-type DNA-binding domain-containing protein [Magnetococcales bacterium]